MRVIVAIDDTPASEHIVNECIRRHWPPDTEFKVLTVIEPLCLNLDEWSDIADQVREKRAHHAERFLGEARRKLESRIPKSIVHYEIKEGSPKAAIVDAAVGWSADKIVLGAYSKDICPHNLPGSVSRAVVSHAPCSVEIIRPKVKQVAHASSHL